MSFNLKYFGFSVVPLPCPNSVDNCCFCYYDFEHRANIYNCSSTNLHALPLSVPNYTDFVWLENNHITGVLGTIKYLNRIQFLYLRKNIIFSFPESFINALIQSKKLKWFLFAGNRLVSLPLNVQNLN